MKSNKLIAEFMGIEDHQWMGEYVTPNYHTSWDWLMPVVGKIEKYLWDNQGNVGYFDECLQSNDIEVRHQAVIEFIKWYNDYKTCDKCCYDIVDDNGDVMEHHCVDNQKDLALITSIIINEDVLGGTIFQTFDKAYALAEKFQDKFSHDFNWENQKLDFDEAIILFTKQELEKNYTI